VVTPHLLLQPAQPPVPTLTAAQVLTLCSWLQQTPAAEDSQRQLLLLLLLLLLVLCQGCLTYQQQACCLAQVSTCADVALWGCWGQQQDACAAAAAAGVWTLGSCVLPLYLLPPTCADGPCV
jgi:hypothetical protein